VFRNPAANPTLETPMTVRFFSLLTALTLTACADDMAVDGDAADAPIDPSADETLTPVDFGVRGPATVGHSVLTDDELTVKVWYPSDSDAPEDLTYLAQVGIFGPDSPDMPFFGAAVDGAAPAGSRGDHPLVVLSHGFGVSPEWYLDLAEHLASHGFVVIAPEHIEYDWFTDVIPATVQRPQQVSRTIDLAESGVLMGVVDTRHVAVIGHSYGGTTALMSGGARFHTAWLEDHCATNEDPFVEAMFCGVFLGGLPQLADEMGLDAEPTGLWPTLRDDRVDAIVAMAPDAGLFGEVGLGEVDVPSLLLGGTGDTAAPWSWGGALAYDHVSTDTRAMVAFEGSEHFVVTTTCDRMPWTAELPPEFATMFCEDPAWDKPAALRITNETVAAFLAFTLQDDEAGRQALSPESFAGVDGLEVRLESPVPAP
jgi:predicted dienelactone hydrolase